MQLKRSAARVAVAVGVGVASMIGTGAAPATAACVNYGQDAIYDSPYTYSVAWDYKPASSCNDLNIDFVSSTNWYTGWYYSGGWLQGASGWHYLASSFQSPWAVLLTGVYTGTPITATSYNQPWFYISWQI